ncbi:MAG: UDP-N-acetylmuramoyl-L-alanyl-D-glutamate--2,6-diaminopimelate ligase [Bacteroidota bacterium]|nr:UDP-N-acetylmuramoyl-L-alanyl-D-glutamate--2,6-diaminopimelate ligase [Bacteroidota bacterium]MDP4228821.1 UDP-N-acetylmuramoyl-L-alanyl-D-glutamate--2,6-diaminopimelate ligase [Bacteroidota bacterium]MDP4235147.1 UDP-N-acetylmuramoyl-L-alanyl-D-glutamate--2,6-diaminopimelate ligase [Bacteroidota bacterium]
MKFSELTRQREIGILAYQGLKDADLSDPQYDSRLVKPGSTFFAIKGFATDGHSFIKDAIKKGARTIVLEDGSSFSEEDARVHNVNRLLVANSRIALSIISEDVFGSPSRKLRLIGVTGTNGKTTTTNLIKQLLELRGETCGLIGTLGVFIDKRFIPGTHTTPESRDISELLARMLKEGVTTCVMEVSSHSIVLERISALDFDIGVFTNLTQDHLDFHHSMESYAAAKQKFFTGLRETAVAITNSGSPHGEFMTEHTIANAHSYGIDDGSKFGNADLVASDVAYSLRGTKFTVKKRYSDEQTIFDSKLVGKFNVENILAAASALYFGVEGFSLEVLSKAIPQLQPVRGRFEQIELPNGALAIIDYAHTPDALQNVLVTIRALDPSTKVTTVFGCGGDRDRLKRPLMGAIAETLSDRIIITNDNPRTEDSHSIAHEILEGISLSKRTGAIIILDRKEAILTALDSAVINEVILIAGKGHEDYQIIGDKKIHFNDREVVEEWIHNRISNPGSTSNEEPMKLKKS